MDKSEQIAESHLRSRGFQDIMYEPDGNVPPDFLVDGQIAVEVRRLNQNEDTPEGPRGLEEAAIPLQAKIKPGAWNPWGRLAAVRAGTWCTASDGHFLPGMSWRMVCALS